MNIRESFDFHDTKTTILLLVEKLNTLGLDVRSGTEKRLVAAPVILRVHLTSGYSVKQNASNSPSL